MCAGIKRSRALTPTKVLFGQINHNVMRKFWRSCRKLGSAQRRSQEVKWDLLHLKFDFNLKINFKISDAYNNSTTQLQEWYFLPQSTDHLEFIDDATQHDHT